VEEQSSTDDGDDDEELNEIRRKFNKTGRKAKGKAGRRSTWAETETDDLVDIILEDDKLKERLLLTNVKNVKNSQYYRQVIDKMKERFEERGAVWKYDLNQVRNKLKRCVKTCRDAVMKIKTASGIKNFQQEKGYGDWFGKLLPVVSSMDNCQPEQSIEPGMVRRKSLEVESVEKGEENRRGENMESNRASFNSSTSSSTSPSSSLKKKTGKRSYVPMISGPKKAIKTESLLADIKNSVDALKTIATDSSTNDLLKFMKEESERQNERDKSFFDLMKCLV